MATKTFSIDQVIKTGWAKLKERFWFILGMIALVWIVDLALSYIIQFAGRQRIAEVIISLIGYFLTVLMSIGFLKITLKINDGKDVSYADLFVHYRFFIRYLLAIIFKTIIVSAGLILLIFPGIYLALRYRFVEFLIVDKDMGIIEAFKESAKLTEGKKWSILGFEFCSFAIIFLGLIALLVGLLAAAPTVALARANLYRTISSK